jgi:glucose/arabinose dehydrogenase
MGVLARLAIWAIDQAAWLASAHRRSLLFDYFSRQGSRMPIRRDSVIRAAWGATRIYRGPAMQAGRLAFAAVLIGAHFCAAQALVPVGSQAVRLEKVTEGLNGVLTGNTQNSREQMIPVDMTPLGDGRQLIVTLTGHVRLLESSGTLAPGAYLDTYSSNSPPPIATSGGEITDFRQIGNTSITTHPGFLDPLSRGYGKFYTITSELPDNFTPDFDDGNPSSVVDSVVYEWSVASGHLNDSSLAWTEGGAVGDTVTRREVFRSGRPGIIHTVVDMAFDVGENLIITSGDGGGNAFPNTDGGAFNADRFENAQNPQNIFGSILRIDPLSIGAGESRATAGVNNQYYIPNDNFGVIDGDPLTPGETFAYGLRSPYRINVDQQTGNIFLGDVGEGNREEINLIANGGNYGWGAYEGTRVNRGDLVAAAGDAVPPLFELYHNLNGQSESTNIVGGFVYRGSAIPSLQGSYVFADVGENNGGQPTNVVDLYYGDPTTSDASSRDDLYRLQIEVPAGESLPDRIWSIAEDEAGELYLLVGPDRLDLFNRTPGETDGGVWKLTPAQFVLNGVLGDINQDGYVNGNGLGDPASDDVAAFIANYATSGFLTDYEKVTHGDLDLNGATDLLDWLVLYNNLEDPAGLQLASLLANTQTPEPTSSSIIGVLIACGAVRFRRARRGKSAPH